MIEIALVNLMPAKAQKAAARQFAMLLESAAGSSAPFRLQVFAAPDLSGLFDMRVDGVIVTGAEPASDDLRREPSWQTLVEVYDWTERQAIPIVFSCLAAHAAALHADGIAREPLAAKCFGLFDEIVSHDHPLARGLPARVTIPHSRWNALPPAALDDAGYRVLSGSGDAGPDIVIRERRNLTVLLQGHPEYEPNRLFLEYRRDVRRYVAGERPALPDIPRRYFDPATENRLRRFEEAVVDAREAGRTIAFPEDIEAPPIASWAAAAGMFARNWLGYVAERAA